MVEFKVKDIKHEGVYPLVNLVNSWNFSSSGKTFYEPYTYDKLKEQIANQLRVPKQLLTINTNFLVDGNSKMLYPFGF